MEALFAITRKHEINEGFLVTGLLFPLTLPPTIPLWQVANRHILWSGDWQRNFWRHGKKLSQPRSHRPGPSSSSPIQRKFLGMRCGWRWTATPEPPRSPQAATGGLEGITFSIQNAFLGFIPGSMGETSTLACLLGAVYLIATGIGSWRIMLSMTLSTLVLAWLFNMIGSDTNPLFALPPHWHLVIGGFAFGTVFMATDPVSAAMTLKGQYFYGALIGVMTILVRVVNPAFPEGGYAGDPFCQLLLSPDRLVCGERPHQKEESHPWTVKTIPSKKPCWWLRVCASSARCWSLALRFCCVHCKEENRRLDIKKKLLLTAGLITPQRDSREDIEAAFDNVEMQVIELASGQLASHIDPDTFVQEKAAKDAEKGKIIDPDQDIAGLKRRSRYAKVYLIKKDNGQLDQIVLPIKGMGLWSTLYGFLALEADTRTARGLSYYQHGETPGLGGEVDNLRWKSQWRGKILLDSEFQPIVDVLKGAVVPGNPSENSQIDGLAGATITSNGVELMLKYWLGEDGFAPFLKRMREKERVIR